MNNFILISVINFLGIFAILFYCFKKREKKKDIINTQLKHSVKELNELKEKKESLNEQLLQAIYIYDDRLREIDDKSEEIKQLELQKTEINNSLIEVKEQYELYTDKVKDLQVIEQIFQSELFIKTQKEQTQNKNILNISDDNKSEIVELKNFRKRISHKDVIDKLIWEVYYKQPFQILANQLFPLSKKYCGIYKITNMQTNQVYIGQSVDIKTRFSAHIKEGISHKATTNKLYQAMQQYNPYSFVFEVIEEVPREKLNEREKFWIETFKSNELGYNSTKGGS